MNCNDMTKDLYNKVILSIARQSIRVFFAKQAEYFSEDCLSVTLQPALLKMKELICQIPVSDDASKMMIEFEEIFGTIHSLPVFERIFARFQMNLLKQYWVPEADIAVMENVYMPNFAQRLGRNDLYYFRFLARFALAIGSLSPGSFAQFSLLYENALTTSFEFGVLGRIMILWNLAGSLQYPGARPEEFFANRSELPGGMIDWESLPSTQVVSCFFNHVANCFNK